jgi:hypothetical protein
VRTRGFTLAELLLAVILLIICLVFILPVSALLFGWLSFPGHIAGYLTFDRGLCLLGLVALVTATAIAHGLLSGLASRRVTDRPEEEPRWRFGWTLSGVSMLLFLFTSGVCVVGLIWMAGRLWSSDRLLASQRVVARRSQSSNNLKSIGNAVHNYYDTFDRLPSGGTFNEYGEMHHSWQTALLPYLDFENLQVDRNLPWDHADQGATFKTQIRQFQNPLLPSAPKEDAGGFAMSHYAANSRVVGGAAPWRFEDVSDGTSNTILAGEVNHDFRPWGHPVNWRDPAKGINRPGGFGSAKNSPGTQFLMLDGSVRFVREDIGPDVLKAVATPANGDKTDGWRDR